MRLKKRDLLSGSVALLIAVAFAGPLPLNAQSPVPQSLQITIVDGDNALNNIKQRTAREPIVQVTDENHNPVPGAAVLFTLPNSGPGATFADGGKIFTTITNGEGRAFGAAMRPNGVAGKYEIRVDVKSGNLKAHATIHQSNVTGNSSGSTHAVSHAFPMKAVVIGAAVAGAAAVAVAVAVSQSGQSTTITAGTPTVGAPSSAARRLR